MKTLYIECNMGAAGDMLMAALYELLEEKEQFLTKMNALGLSDIQVKAEPAVSCGISGTRMAVQINGIEEENYTENTPDHHHHHDHEQGHHHHDHEPDHHHHDHDHHHHHHEADHHAHNTLDDILQLVAALPLPEKVIADISKVYAMLAAAEGSVHGKPAGQVHFHEVGMLDAIADIAGVCYAVSLLGAERIIVSPIHTGSGQVRCAHGIMPVPAPATAHLLKGIPSYGGEIKGELCTPTGAALLAYYGEQFGPLPVMITDRIGYGIGKREFSAANCVRVFLGDMPEHKTGSNGEILELCCTLDDMTPEALAYACEELQKAGALDVYVTPIHMKKGRSAMLLTVLCDPEQEEELAALILYHTTTIGLRVKKCGKYYLTTDYDTADTQYGQIRIKKASGYGVCKEKPEYEDVAKAAQAHGASFQEVWAAADRK